MTSLVEPTWQECKELLDRLPGLPLTERVEALERLVQSTSPGVRQQALRMGTAVFSDDRLVDYLRKDADAALRNAGLEILKMRGARSFSLAVELLADDDPDVALQAVLVLDHIKDPRALEPLRSSLHHPDPNVIQAAIVAIGHLGDARAIPDLLPFTEGDPWVQMAAVQALGDLRSVHAVPILAKLLTDLMVGSLAAEALARIGGVEAFEVLARHWLGFADEIDAETTLGLLAHVLEGLPRSPTGPEGLRVSLAARLEEEGDLQLAAARSLLALGPGEEDDRALAILAASRADGTILPTCLMRRDDLIGKLLEGGERFRAWGFLLAARYPEKTPAYTLVDALARATLPDELEPLTRVLTEVKLAELGEALLDLYLRLPAEQRAALTPLVRLHGSAVTEALGRRRGVDPAARLVLLSLLGGSVEEITAQLLELPDIDRVAVLGQITGCTEVLLGLPWNDWLRETPELYRNVAAEVAAGSKLVELLPALRELLARSPSPALVRAVAALEDRESVPFLVSIVDRPAGETGPLQQLVVESLGRIGGPEAREALRATATSGDPDLERLAYRALAGCAAAGDDEFFRGAAEHPDWTVRLACAEVLGRFARSENLAVLAQLAADRVPIVAQRALSFFEA